MKLIDILKDEQLLTCILNNNIRNLDELELPILNKCLSHTQIPKNQKQQIVLNYLTARDNMESNETMMEDEALSLEKHQSDFEQIEELEIETDYQEEDVYIEEDAEDIDIDLDQLVPLQVSDIINALPYLDYNFTTSLSTMNDYIDDVIDVNDVYNRSKYNVIPTKIVLKSINKHFLNVDFTNLNAIYDYLRDSFKVKSFNRKNLSQLLLKYYGDDDDKSINIPEALKNLQTYLMSHDIDGDYDNHTYLITNKLLKRIYAELLNIEELFGREFLIALKTFSFKKSLEVINSIVDDNRVLPSLTDEFKNLLSLFINFTEYFKDSSEKDFDFFKTIYYNQMNKISLMSKIERLLDSIPTANYNIKIKNIFTGVILEDCELGEIYNIGDFIDIIKEAPPFWLQFYLNKIMLVFSSLTVNIKQQLIDIVSLNEEKYLPILKSRYEGETLNKIAKEYNVTRERIRQIESKGIERLSRILRSDTKHKENLFKLIDNKHYVTLNDLENIYDGYASAIYYVFLKSDITYNDNSLRFVSFSSFDWVNIVEYNTVFLPNVMHIDKVMDIANKYCQYLDYNSIYIKISDMVNIISSKLYRHCQYFSKSTLNYSQKYDLVLRKHFAKGLNLGDENEINKFRDYHNDMFGEDLKDKTTRSIEAIIQRIGANIDRGVYAPEDSINQINEDLMKRLVMYIKSHEYPLMFRGLYEIFETELQLEGIEKYTQLQWLLKKELSNKSNFYFRRDYVFFGNELLSPREVLEIYIVESKKMLTYDDILEEFSTYNKTQLYNTIAESTDLMSLGMERTIHKENLNLSSETIRYFKQLINTQIERSDFIIIDKLFEIIQVTRPDIFDDYNIIDKHVLYGYLQELFQDDFDFSKPYISKRGSALFNQKSILDNYIYNREEISIKNFRDFLYNQKLRVISLQEYIEDLFPAYIRIEEDILIKSEKINITKDKLNQIKTMLPMLLKNRETYDLVNFNNYDYLPDIGYKWNMYLLGNIIRLYFKGVSVENNGANYNLATLMIRKKSKRIEVIE